MAKLRAVKNTSNRTLELVFSEQNVERIDPRTTGKFHSESEWNGSFAEKQVETFVAHREAKVIEKDEVASESVKPTPNQQPSQTDNGGNSTNKTKGEK